MVHFSTPTTSPQPPELRLLFSPLCKKDIWSNPFPPHFLLASNFWTPAQADVSYEFGSVRLSIPPQPKISELACHFFFCFLALKWEKWALSLLSRPVGKAQNVPQNLIHDRDLINLYIISLLEYEITNSLQRFCKNHISRKNLVLDLWSQNL